MFDPSNTPHRRYNPLTGEWILVSPHRTIRPWQGKQEISLDVKLPEYDPQCYLCPGNQRAGGIFNPNYSNTFVFSNDFSALLSDTQQTPYSQEPLLQSNGVKGECRVLCFSPRHDLTLPEMSFENILSVIETWKNQTLELRSKYQWIQIFENKGAVMGCSNPHPHGQIWASDFLPNEVTKEERQQQQYFEKNRKALLLDYAKLEQEKKERIVAENEHWLVVVPYWAIWPFETLLLPKRSMQTLLDLTSEESLALAEILIFFFNTL